MTTYFTNSSWSLEAAALLNKTNHIAVTPEGLVYDPRHPPHRRMGFTNEKWSAAIDAHKEARRRLDDMADKGDQLAIMALAYLASIIINDG